MSEFKQSKKNEKVFHQSASELQALNCLVKRLDNKETVTKETEPETSMHQTTSIILINVEKKSMHLPSVTSTLVC